MRKLIVLGVSAVVLALGVAQASATCNAAACGPAPVVGQAYDAPAADGKTATAWTHSHRSN